MPLMPLYFSIARSLLPEGVANEAAFDSGWWEIPSGAEPFYIDRTVWRSEAVSASPDRCIRLTYSLDFKSWLLTNFSKVPVSLFDGEMQYQLARRQSQDLGDATWTGSVLDLFEFEVRTDRPDTDHFLTPSSYRGPVRDGPTLVREKVRIARQALRNDWQRRLGLAHRWRQSICHTTAEPEELNRFLVARDFGVDNRRVSRWETDLAQTIYGESQHQGVLRDFLIANRLLTARDVADADEHIQSLRGHPRQRDYRRPIRDSETTVRRRPDNSGDRLSDQAGDRPENSGDRLHDQADDQSDRPRE